MNSPVVNSANVLIGSARLLVAPIGTPLPTIVANALVWVAAWKEVGATAKGTDIAYSPTYADVKVDESASPIGKILTTEKTVISCSMAEATLTNLSRAIAASTFTATPAGALQCGLEEVDAGSGMAINCMVGLEGIGTKGFARYIIGYKALASAAVKLAFARTTQTDIPLSLELLADTTQPLGKQLFKMVDIVAVATA